MRLLALFFFLLTFSCTTTNEKSTKVSIDTVGHELTLEAKTHNESEQIDNSPIKLSIKRISETVGNDSIIFNELKRVDLGHLFRTEDYSMDGAIGDNYKRLKINIGQAKKSNVDSLTYKVVGKSKVNSNICDFIGQIKIESATKYEEAENDNGDEGPPYDVMGGMSGSFEFHEDKAQTGSGIFRGSFGIKWTINDDYEIVFGDIWYTYRMNVVSFTGQWIEYKTGKSKTICWSDYIPTCLPDDFNCSDGPDFIPCEKYANNGWETLRAIFDYQNKTLQDQAEKAELEKWWR